MTTVSSVAQINRTDTEACKDHDLHRLQWDKHARSVAGYVHVHTVSTHESTYSFRGFNDHVSVVSIVSPVSDTVDISVLDTKVWIEV